MFKRLLIAAVAVAGALAIQKKVRDQRAEQELWSEATDDVRSDRPKASPAK